jgi:hypothetical protein
MSKAIASSIKDFAFDTLLMRAIATEKDHDGEGTEHDPSDGTGFEAVQNPTASSTTPPLAATSIKPASPTPTDTARDFGDSSGSEPSSDADTSTRKRKKKSKSRIAYKKLAFKRRRAADRQSTKDDIEASVRPSIRERHTASANPINVPSFNLDTKTAAKTGYVGVRDSRASKQVYSLNELIGGGSKFKFNLVEWDGK